MPLPYVAIGKTYFTFQRDVIVLKSLQWSRQVYCDYWRTVIDVTNGDWLRGSYWFSPSIAIPSSDTELVFIPRF